MPSPSPVTSSPGRKSTSSAAKSARSDGSGGSCSVSTFFDSGGRSYGARCSAPASVICPANPRPRSSSTVRNPARPAPATRTCSVKSKTHSNVTPAGSWCRLAFTVSGANWSVNSSVMDSTLADPLTGRLLDGRYAISARIAHGGMATVYLATDTRLDRQVAVKVMHAELARDDDFVRRFIGEAKSVARLSHQNVVAVYDQGADGPFLYLAMEYVPGRTLKQLLQANGRFGVEATLEIMAGVLDGLAAAHAAGLAHRDIKPENVLITADGRVKVADFGLARAHAAAGHTRSGTIIGTVAYLAPEQVSGAEPAGPYSDVYSAGVLLYELLTGRQPFTGETPIAVAFQHVNSRVPAPSRAARVLAVAAAHGHRTLVLGAWGCGVFRNDPAVVAAAFAALLARASGRFDHVVFAVLDHQHGAPTHAAFTRACLDAGTHPD